MNLNILLQENISILNTGRYGGDDIIITSEVPDIPEGSSFKGWCENEDGTGKMYTSGETWEKPTTAQNMNLYAVWEEELQQFTITYDANGGTGAPGIQTKTSGEEVTLSTTSPTRSGYKFKGWATSLTATSVEYQPGDPYTVDEDVTLYAVWEKQTIISYKITYNANGGTGAPTYQTKIYGEELTLSTQIPEKEGYNFLGWATSSTATSATYQPGDTYTANAAATLYAVWEAETYTLTYDFKGGTTGSVPTSQTWNYGEQLYLAYVESDEYPTKDGYTFGGWCEDEEPDHQDYYPGQLIADKTEDFTLYAWWVPVSDSGPYIPSGFSHVDGTDLDTGYTIQDSLGNQYVWIEVPRTTDVYSESTLALDLDNLSGSALTKAYYAIEDDLHSYTAKYRDVSNIDFSDTWSSEETTGLTESSYYELKNKMLKSVFENGGFYIGKYEAGIADSYRTYSATYVDPSYVEHPITEEVVIQANVYPYNWVTCSQAQSLASEMQSGEYTSSLLFGVQFDLVLKYLQTKGATVNELTYDSTKWGNYFSNTYTTTALSKYSKDNGANWTEGTYKSTSENDTVFLTTGACSKFCKQGIYDLAGSLNEWTLENYESSYTDGVMSTYRAGGYNVHGMLSPASKRGGGSALYNNHCMGFRVALY